MQKKTRSILEELEAMYIERDQRHIVETRANNIIASANRRMEQIEENFPGEQGENLQRKFLNAIKFRDPTKFTRTVRKTDETT